MATSTSSGTVPTSTAISSSTTSALDETYGKGIGTALSTALSGLGTSTSNAVTTTNNAAMTTGKEGFNTLQGQQAAAGISPNSSSSALEGSDYWAQFDTNLNSTDANMELSEENTLINSLQTAGSEHGADESTFSKISSIATPIIEGAALLA